MLRFVLFISFLAQPAIAADEPMSPTEFEALVTGQILSYSSQSQEYGVEEYLEDRRVRWAYPDGQCTEGHWYEAGDQICFEYDGIATPQCWTFHLRDETLTARFKNVPQGALHETKRLDTPPLCLGPDVGA
ncbi:MAG: hypothetical protein ABJF50_06405 [Paracoccaceae bacterium]